MKRTCVHVNTCIRRMKKDDSSTHPRRLHFIHRWYGILICCYVHEMILPSCSLILSCILFLLSGMMIMLDRGDDEASILSWMFGIGFMFVWYYLIKHDSTRSGHIGFNSCLSSYVGQWRWMVLAFIGEHDCIPQWPQLSVWQCLGEYISALLVGWNPLHSYITCSNDFLDVVIANTNVLRTTMIVTQTLHLTQGRTIVNMNQCWDGRRENL